MLPGSSDSTKAGPTGAKMQRHLVHVGTMGNILHRVMAQNPLENVRMQEGGRLILSSRSGAGCRLAPGLDIDMMADTD